jgi:hypothetical protein
MVNYIDIDEEKIPVRFNTRVRIQWEKQTDKLFAYLGGQLNATSTGYLAEPANTEETMLLCFLMLKEGHRIDKKKFKYTIEDIYELQDNHGLEDKIAAVVFNSVEKK